MKTAFNNLTFGEAERLAYLSEELGEAIQAIGKILRHGYNSTNPDSAKFLHNRDQLESDLGDINAALGLMFGYGDINPYKIKSYCSTKSEVITRYLHHCESFWKE